jgi:hypothetical protein
MHEWCRNDWLHLENDIMVTRGRVENGVVVFESGVTLPEGIEVTVIIDAVATENPTQPKRHRVLEIPTYSFGKTLRPLSSDDDILGEMLEGRS